MDDASGLFRFQRHARPVAARSYSSCFEPLTGWFIIRLALVAIVGCSVAVAIFLKFR
jgi:hypothetical protein